MIPRSVLVLLEFDKLLHMISSAANSEASQQALLDIEPLQDKAAITRRFGLVEEIRRIAHEGNPLALSAFKDISEFVARVRPYGAVLEGAELACFIPVLEISVAISLQLNEGKDLPLLHELAEELTGYPDILRILSKSVDSEGNILDSASAVLFELRRRIGKLELNIQKKLGEFMRDSRIAVFLQDDFVTKKAGRWVIPVRMDSKGQVPGVVHDVSRSGETAFIEPLDILGVSNELENLVAEGKAEEIRILRSLSSKIRENAEGIEREFGTLVHLDMLHCIARVADQMHMETPLISDSGIICLSGARHPLLIEALKVSGTDRNVVPLEVDLGKGSNVMVITGSNAGGKTIAIKTIGLLTVMALSGMPVPSGSSSSFPLIDNLLIDIGDEQSIESSLSTFSAHVSNIADILERADSRSLILIDELGTGTDPDEGAALSCAVLNQLQKSGALVFATTHLTGIKGFVHRTEGMINAAMEFDSKRLAPLYRLRIGEPGQSHALEIARKYGMPDSIIIKAKELIGGISIEFENLLAEMHEKRIFYEERLEKLREQQEEMDRSQEIIDKKLSETEARSRELVEHAYKEAAGIIAEAKRDMHQRLDEIKKMDKEAVRRTIQDIEKKQKLLSDSLRQIDKADALDIDRISVGDAVFVISLGCDAAVAEVLKDQKKLRVRAGTMEIEVPVADVRAGRGRPFSHAGKNSSHDKEIDRTVPSRINFIGLRVDETLGGLERFLNHASLAGYPEVTVIHGIGKGLLSRAIREHLEGHPLVKKFRAGDRSEGGNGVTIVELT